MTVETRIFRVALVPLLSYFASIFFLFFLFFKYFQLFLASPSFRLLYCYTSLSLSLIIICSFMNLSVRGGPEAASFFFAAQPRGIIWSFFRVLLFQVCPLSFFVIFFNSIFSPKVQSWSNFPPKLNFSWLDVFKIRILRLLSFEFQLILYRSIALWMFYRRCFASNSMRWGVWTQSPENARRWRQSRAIEVLKNSNQALVKVKFQLTLYRSIAL